MNRHPPVKTEHLFRMTDDTGLFQHACGAVPDLREGYTADDNARALLAASLLFGQSPSADYERLLERYTAFLLLAQNDDGTFRNFMGYDRRFLERCGSEDCFGRCLWAVCALLSRPSTPRSLRPALEKMLRRALPRTTTLRFLRAKAYAAVGLSLLEPEEHRRALIAKLAQPLADAYQAHQCPGWRWFEETMTYCNSVLPRALLLASRLCEREDWRRIGLESLRFLISQTTEDGHFHAVGCKGWLQKGGCPAAYDEQPVEACGSVLACLTAYDLTRGPAWLQQAQTGYEWYWGQNAQGVRMTDEATGGCYDGLCADGVNRNEGAESLVSFWIAHLTLAAHLKAG